MPGEVNNLSFGNWSVILYFGVDGVTDISYIGHRKRKAGTDCERVNPVFDSMQCNDLKTTVFACRAGFLPERAAVQEGDMALVPKDLPDLLHSFQQQMDELFERLFPLEKRGNLGEREYSPPVDCFETV